MITLRFPTPKDEQEAINYIKEFYQYNSPINGTGGLDSSTDYTSWMKQTINFHHNIDVPKKYVPATTLFAFNNEDVLVGMVNIRHILNDYLTSSGSGHIGYSVRPTQRRQGYAKEILRLSLIILHNEYFVDTALVGCYKDNIGSRKTIESNGGILQREILEEDGRITLAYHIELD